MRIQRVHAQGLHAPRGELDLALESGYNALVARDPSQLAALAVLVRGLLQPDCWVGDFADWVEPGADAPRADLALGIGSGGYRHIVDFARRRQVLAVYDPASGSYKRVAAERQAVSRALEAVGIPPGDAFAPLQGLDCYGLESRAPAPEATQPTPEPAPVAEPEPQRQPQREGQPQREPRERPSRAELSRALEHAENLRRKREDVESRLEGLGRWEHRIATLEAEIEKLEGELEQRSALAETRDDLGEQIERFRELVSDRFDERREIDTAVRSLVEERDRQTMVIRSQNAWGLGGVVLGVAGVISGAVLLPVLAAAGLIGAGIAVTAIVVGRSARRRISRVDARLAALAVRRRVIDRSFDSEGGTVRRLMDAIGTDSVDELARELEAYREAAERAKQLASDLEGARAEYPGGVEAEREDLHKTLAGLEDAPDPVEIRSALLELSSPPAASPNPAVSPDEEEAQTQSPTPSDEAAVATPFEGPDDIVEAAAAWTGRSTEELQRGLRAPLPLYLRGLTAGRYAHAEPGGGWAVARETGDTGVAISSLAPESRTAVRLAFRLALAEELASEFPVPFLVGPELAGADLDANALGRALRRLGSLVQVLHFAPADGPWSEYAHAVRRVD